MNIVLLGAPGAGKGTQAVRIAEKYGLVHISTGDIFRANIKDNTPIGQVAKSYIDAGKLVPDEVTCEIVRQRLEKKDVSAGYVLDGFPRNLIQAHELDKFASIDVCLDIDVDEALLLERICGRRVCSCGASYHISTLNGKDTCAKCGGKLYAREDDNPETVKARLATYNIQTAPLISYYGAQNKLKTVMCGTKTPDEVFAAVCGLLG
ncbi:MAG: adenylate kinase [Clostridia bacterium]|jgi:adenylate kinase|nr:adenylate kinase [Clostridia bacterium]